MEYWWEDYGWIFKAIAIGALCFFGIASCAESEWYQAEQARQASERIKRATPKVVREFDGCKVYAFDDGGHTHYVTRCPASTETETNWTVPCGKARCRRSESQTTQNESAAK